MPPRGRLATADIRGRLDRRGPKKCAVELCFKPTHQLSRWCLKHAQREGANGAPEQLAIRYPELKPFKLIAKRWLDANEGHPGLVMVYADLDKLLHDASLLPVTRRPTRRDP